MTAKSLLLRPQGLRSRAHAPTPPPLPRHCFDQKTSEVTFSVFESSWHLLLLL